MKQFKNLIRCPKGHFFDADKFDVCPHCSNTEKIEETMFVLGKEGDNKKESAAEPKNVEPKGSEPKAAEPKRTGAKGAGAKNAAKADEEKKSIITAQDSEIKPTKNTSAAKGKEDNMTIRYFERALGTNPAVAWLVCIKGAHFGEDFRIKSGRNFIGRSGDMHICLSADKSVSRDKHAILTYDPKTIKFSIQPGDSDELFYVNDELILIPKELKAHDRISIGESEFIFVPFCSKKFNW